MTAAEALRRWADLLAVAEGGYHVVRLSEEDDTTVDAYVHTGPCDFGDYLTRTALRRPVDLLVSMVPRTVRGEFDAVGESSALWVTTSGTASTRILSRYKPLPAVVLREGDTSHRTALWPLERTLRYEWTLEANRRLAHFLRAPKASCRPETLLPPPGALVLGNRATPVPIVVERFTADRFRAKDVIRGLRPAPDANAWRKAT